MKFQARCETHDRRLSTRFEDRIYLNRDGDTFEVDESSSFYCTEGGTMWSHHICGDSWKLTPITKESDGQAQEQ